MLRGIGVAGCGRMGAPMLAALRKAGFDARGFDIRPPEDFGALARHVTDDPETFSAGLRVLITVVRNAAQTEDVLFGAQRLVRRAADLDTIVISSTLSPRYLHDLANRIPARISLVDAPMSGAAHAAEDRQLSFMIGGTADEVDRLMPLFRAMGRHFHHMGGFGTGMAAKVLNNLLAATNTAVTRLVLDWADAQGIDERRLLDTIATSSGQNWLASGFERIEFARDGYDPENTIGILIKDIDAAIDAAPESAETALFRAVQQVLTGLAPRPRR